MRSKWNKQVITSGVTVQWVAPAGVKWLFLQGCGGGGGGGGGGIGLTSLTTRPAGGGGGGAGMETFTLIPVVPGRTYNIVCGAGGSAGAGAFGPNVNGSPGGNGAATTVIDSTNGSVVAQFNGGQGGQGGTPGNPDGGFSAGGLPIPLPNTVYSTAIREYEIPGQGGSGGYNTGTAVNGSAAPLGFKRTASGASGGTTAALSGGGRAGGGGGGGGGCSNSGAGIGGAGGNGGAANDAGNGTAGSAGAAGTNFGNGGGGGGGGGCASGTGGNGGAGNTGAQGRVILMWVT